MFQSDAYAGTSGTGVHATASAQQHNNVVIGGIEVTRYSRKELTELVVQKTLAPTSERPLLMFDINGEGLALGRKNQQYKDCLEAADIIHVDSEPLVIASRILTSTPVKERSATTDLFDDFSAAFEKSNISCYFLGTEQRILDKCTANMQAKYPGLKIVGTRNGYFSEDEIPQILEDINQSGADILWIGMGKPREQIFSVKYRDSLKSKWVITCGGCFNFAAGEYKRAPLFVQKAGFEWLHRMVLRPRALFWRYLYSNPIAFYLSVTKTWSLTADGDRKGKFDNTPK